MLESDLAVLEQRDRDGQWEIIIYIGPDRSAADSIDFVIAEDRPVRIRYLSR